VKITFLGATETVTGSKYLVQTNAFNVMVDCGLFQGRKDLRLRNWEELPIDPKSIDALILTHAHMDHSGYIPRLVKSGFSGRIYCSSATFDLCKILLTDSGRLQEEDAERANRYGYTKHQPALPLYTEQDAQDCLSLFCPVGYGATHDLTPELNFNLYRAGHILGSCFVRLSQVGGTSILFSGDIGRLHDPVMKPPAKIQKADYLVVESTYGDRLHDTDNPTEQIGQVVRETAAKGGTVVIPSFAVGRAQSILYHLYILKMKKQIPNIPIYLDSPMSIRATELLLTHMNEHRLSEDECEAVCDIAQYTKTVEQSKAIHDTNDVPKVIISASGMATGGRILHHLKNYIGDPRSTILLAGFQAAGTRGDRLARGEDEIKIHGQMWPVRARIVKMDSMSAHADYNEILTWIENFTSPPNKVFVTHGEADAANSLKSKIEEKFGLTVIVPTYGHSEEI
jgi:metallo-beta-lactamase family protein